MVNNSKVLTVSYGTFSCTLEGFDDSFDTMKAIAEYFRDLAGDDRYFGAEPPTPDAEMLARIAEREITRRVAARQDQDGIVLTATPLPEAAAHSEASSEPAPVTTPASVPEPVLEAVPEPQATVSVQEPVQTPALEVPGPVSAPETLADALAPEAEDASQEATAAAEPAPQPVEEMSETISDSPAPVEDQAAPEPIEAEQPATAEMVDVEPDRPDPVKPEPAKAEPVKSEPIEAEPVEIKQPSPDDDSIAAKLQRIRDVVSKSEGNAAADLYDEDEHADPFLASVARDIESALEIDDQNADVLTDQEILADLDGTLDSDTDAVDEAEQPPVQESPEPQPQSKAQRVRARVIRMKRSDVNPSASSATPGDTSDKGDTAEVEETTAQTAPKAPPAPAPETAEPLPDPVDTTLTPEEEADLMAELAEVEAELGSSDMPAVEAMPEELVSEPASLAETTAAETTPDFAEQPETETPTEAEAETEAPTLPPEAQPIPKDGKISLRRRQLPDESDTEMSRLLEKTNTRMDEPEQSRRRSAIAHLRAAVAATKAEGSREPEADDTAPDAIRDDLVNVAKPRRTRPSTDRSPKKRAAPLKLVASQRVDVDDSDDNDTAATPKDRGPVRPRRVSSQDIPAEPAADSRQAQFREFADDRGVQTMGDLVEAAASFLYFELDWQGFTRQQILKLCRDAHDETFNREDGLRSFGQLLRSGKIEKGEGGRFTASDRIGFRDQDGRQAG